MDTPRCRDCGDYLTSDNTRRGASDNSPTLDKIIPEMDYVRGNIAVMSSRANRIKNDASLAELAAVAAVAAVAAFIAAVGSQSLDPRPVQRWAVSIRPCLARSK